MEISKTDDTFYAEIRDMLQQARNTAYHAVNTVMVTTYWQIGKRIVEREQHGQNRAGYGDSLMWNFHKFYLRFPEFSTRRVENLSWSHFRLYREMPV
jgi:hypothetical protein